MTLHKLLGADAKGFGVEAFHAKTKEELSRAIAAGYVLHAPASSSRPLTL